MAKWDPFTEIGTLQKELNKIFYDGFVSEQNTASTGNWAPRLEISELKDAYQIKAELPGVSKELIDISVLDKTLTIKGERNKPENEEASFFKREINYGPFQREIILPEDINGEEIRAACENGVLTLNIPKKEKVKNIKIEIN